MIQRRLLSKKKLPRTFLYSCLLACSGSASAKHWCRSLPAFQSSLYVGRLSNIMTASTNTGATSPLQESASTSLDGTPVSPRDPLEALGLPRPLILGSGSFTRKLILKEMGVNYHLLVRSIDERSIGDREKDDPRSLVLTLAKAKGDHLVSQMTSGSVTDEELPIPPGDHAAAGWVVLTADQVVTHEGTILEKPLDIEEAKSFVSRYGNSAPSTVGAVVLTHVPSGVQVSGVDSSTIVFRSTIGEKDNNGKDLIDKLLEDDAPVLKCAGGLMVEHPFVREHLERIDGTEDSVMGLSKDLVERLLTDLKEKLNEQGIL